MEASRPGRKGLKFWIASLVLKVLGWKPEGNIPQVKQYVLIAGPHTSGWDFVLMMAFGWWYGMRFNWLGKDALFKGPKGVFFRMMGGIAVDRSKNNNLVDAAAAEFADRGEFALAVPAEGTRKFRPYWKSGFYYIAKTAGVPVAMSYLDFSRKRAGFHSELLWPSGDLTADMDEVRAFYTRDMAKYPEKFSTPVLRGEKPEGEAVEPDTAQPAQPTHPPATPEG